MKDYECDAQKIIDFLNKGYNVRVTMIVIDFLKDQNGVNYVLSCKGFKVDEATLKNSLNPVSE